MKNFFVRKIIFLSIFVCLILFSCKKEPQVLIDYSQECEEAFDLGYAVIEDSSKEFFNYEIGQKVVFKDSFETKAEFILDTVFTTFELSVLQDFCQYDQSFLRPFHAKEENMIAILTNDSLNIQFRITLYAKMEDTSWKNRDYLSIRRNSIVDGFLFEAFSMSISERNPPLNMVGIPGFLQRWSKHGKEFENVFRQKTFFANIEYETFYNTSSNLIGFKDSDKKFWVLDL